MEIMGERNDAIEALLDRAANHYGIPEMRNITYGTNDRGETPGVYSLCYNKHQPEKEKYCGPDCFFWNWPSASIYSFKETRDQIRKSSKIPPTIDKVGWVGNIYSPLPDVPEYKTRPLLKKYGDMYPEIFDIKHVLPQKGIIDNSIPNYASLPELTKYKYLIDIGGNGWSGRLKFLLFMRRPLFLVDRNYIEYFYKDLVPFVHYIPVKMDLSDLLDKYMWAINHPKKTKKIAKRAYKFAVENFTEEKICERILYVWWNQCRLPL